MSSHKCFSGIIQQVLFVGTNLSQLMLSGPSGSVGSCVPRQHLVIHCWRDVLQHHLVYHCHAIDYLLYVFLLEIRPQTAPSHIVLEVCVWSVLCIWLSPSQSIYVYVGSEQ